MSCDAPLNSPMDTSFSVSDLGTVWSGRRERKSVKKEQVELK
jgi:translation elongation factor EF-Tu-like GTPase